MKTDGRKCQRICCK